MHYLDLTLDTPAENLALDEALLLDAESRQGEEVLRVWELSQLAVVLGASAQISVDVYETVCQADGVPVLRRCSGGGTVLLGVGCLNYSLVLSMARTPPLQDVTHSYCYILGRLAKALSRASGVTVTCAGTSDLAVEAFKFSGNAQRRLRHYLLHHGTILYAFDLGLLERYLKQPARQPAYRVDRTHRKFVRNFPAMAPTLRSALCEEWRVDCPATSWPRTQLVELVKDKYTNREWLQRRV